MGVSLKLLWILIIFRIASTFVCSMELTPIDVETLNPPYSEQPHFCTLCKLPSDDCLALSLEYLEKENDLNNFRKAAIRFEKIYERYREYQSKRFRALNVVFEQMSPGGFGPYDSLDDLLQCVRCIDQLYVDIDDPQSRDKLRYAQFVAGQEMVRGLTSRTNHPFLSLSLWNNDFPNDSLFLICVVDFDHVAKVTMVRSRFYVDKVTSDVTDFPVEYLEGLLSKRNRLMDTKGEWYVGTKNWVDFNYSTHKFNKRRASVWTVIVFCMAGALGCGLVAIFLVYVIALVVKHI